MDSYSRTKWVNCPHPNCRPAGFGVPLYGARSGIRRRWGAAIRSVGRLGVDGDAGHLRQRCPNLCFDVFRDLVRVVQRHAAG